MNYIILLNPQATSNICFEHNMFPGIPPCQGQIGNNLALYVFQFPLDDFRADVNYFVHYGLSKDYTLYLIVTSRSFPEGTSPFEDTSLL